MAVVLNYCVQRCLFLALQSFDCTSRESFWFVFFFVALFLSLYPIASVGILPWYNVRRHMCACSDMLLITSRWPETLSVLLYTRLLASFLDKADTFQQVKKFHNLIIIAKKVLRVTQTTLLWQWCFNCIICTCCDVAMHHYDFKSLKTVASVKLY